MKGIAFVFFLLLIAAIVKPRGARPGMSGWLAEYASFVQTCVRVGVIAGLIFLCLGMLGLLEF